MSARTTGPRKRPTRPNAEIPPTTPKNAVSVPISARPDTSAGRRKLSALPATRTPQASMKIHFHATPCARRKRTAGPTTRDVPTNGMKDAMKASPPKTTGDLIPQIQNAIPISMPWASAVTIVPKTTARVTSPRWRRSRSFRFGSMGTRRKARSSISSPSRKKKNRTKSITEMLPTMPKAPATKAPVCASRN